jgi:hypothetical protein
MPSKSRGEPAIHTHQSTLPRHTDIPKNITQRTHRAPYPPGHRQHGPPEGIALKRRLQDHADNGQKPCCNGVGRLRPRIPLLPCPAHGEASLVSDLALRVLLDALDRPRPAPLRDELRVIDVEVCALREVHHGKVVVRLTRRGEFLGGGDASRGGGKDGSCFTDGDSSRRMNIRRFPSPEEQLRDGEDQNPPGEEDEHHVPIVATSLAVGGRPGGTAGGRRHCQVRWPASPGWRFIIVLHCCYGGR